MSDEDDNSIYGRPHMHDDHVVNLTDDSDMKLTDIEGFENADYCPHCDTPRPFGVRCVNCGALGPEADGYRSGSPSPASATGTNVSLDGVYVTIVTAATEAAAKAKARVALDEQAESPDWSVQDTTLKLVDEIDNSAQLFPAKWGDMPSAVSVDSTAGQEFLKTTTSNACLDASNGATRSTIVDEQGEPVMDRDRLEEVLTGAAAVAPRNEPTVWLVPILSYSEIPVCQDDQEPVDTDDPDSHPDPDFGPGHTVESAAHKEFEEVMETLEAAGKLSR